MKPLQVTIGVRSEDIPHPTQWALEPLEQPKPPLVYVDPYVRIRNELRLCEPTMRGDILLEYFSKEYQRVKPKNWWQRRREQKELAYYRDAVAWAMLNLARKLFVETETIASPVEDELTRFIKFWKRPDNMAQIDPGKMLRELELIVSRCGHNGTERRYHG